MVDDDQIARSKRIQQRTGKTFHFATRVLPERVREPTYVLYAFFRVADEVVDAAETAPPAEQRRELDHLRDAALGREEADDPVLAAFAEMREEHGIADEDVETFIEAMRSDIDTDRYETYDDLEAYMDGSASAVGRMMTAVMEPDEPEAALPHATALGEAFQLSNFLRDVREDVVDLDRVYLPQETLREYGVTEDQLKRFEFDERVEAVMRHELRRAESLYKEGVAGIKYLPEDCQFAVLLAAVLYAEHHALIRERGFDTLSETPSLSTLRKLKLFVRTRWAWFRSKDPETVFRRVSCIPYGDSDSSHSGAGHGDHVAAR
ncbi:phytoene/squalene synthase family protein [Halobaculum sp. CBA1158]|uniref:phytoene/squalene synthase family protein n=1 Tax=Halobaculum sp. CBA1158 TaxID=2904243 RepID=UPI001F3B7D58|nr:phytoene/squalene synthase family protein [Halobaculum sp. CBA1158]UIP00946.1 phytoene/squalene synthase family protein [Halobaculum sp. CBA1158]